MQGLFEIVSDLAEALQRDQVSNGRFWMPAMAESFQLTLLSGAKPSGSASEMGLFQRPSSQAPAERNPSERPGSRVR